jgi:uncharacterized membrane protein
MRADPGGASRARRRWYRSSVTRTTQPRRALDGAVWLVFGVLFVGAALLLKVFFALVAVLIGLAIALALVLRVIRRRA